MANLKSKRVLVLNGNWVPISTIEVQEAFVRISRENTKNPRHKPYYALNIDYPIVDGEFDYGNPSSIYPVDWESWIDLPIRAFDEHIATAKMKIRVPTIIIANNYKKVPKRKLKFSKSGVWNRDGFKCQITSKPLTFLSGSIDHWIPSSKGGPSTFGNCLLVSKELNSKKGDSTMEEFCNRYGYPLPAKPIEPELQPNKIRNIFNIPDWDIFLK